MSNDGGGTGAAKGRMVGGRYRLVERIGSGGSGTVWRAHDELVQREVAVRQPRLPGDPADDSHRRAAHRLHREARAAARVDHPAAVTIHDVVVEPVQQGGRLGPQGPDELDATEMLDGLPWIVMEWVRGESLHDRIRRGPVDEREAARIGLAVLGALRTAHSVGIVHRDLKPANVLLGPHERVVVTDFGIAQPPPRGQEALTEGGEFGGSPEFVAPERMSGRIAGPASDLWSLGVLLYAAVEGTSPFRRATPEATVDAILAAESPETRQAGPLGPLIARLLLPDPEQRPDAEEVVRELEAVAGPLPLSPVEEIPTAGQKGEEPGEPAVDGSGPGPGPDLDPCPGPGTHAHAADGPPEPPKRHSLLRPAPLALLSALLAGGMGAATHVADTSSAESAEQAVGTTDAWTAHPEPDMAAVLHLPHQYRPLGRSGSSADLPRTALYGDGPRGTVQVRLLFWDKAPGSPMDRARKAHGAGGETRYTRTSVQGHEAALTDTTYDRDGVPRRVMRAVIRTDDDRMYELRVDMPKGMPQEREGTSVFRGARDRLGIVKG
ncbi:protein kinase [Streptomyces sp. NPDC019990]|uniref:protein kinase domain-containing protein n=1 Tax=Streptomyces sp. NPDC019990 TaxID=3154693 RepID=UPI0033D54644